MLTLALCGQSISFMIKIQIIYTGGTIGMVNDTKTGALIPFDFEQIKVNVPELVRLDYQLDVQSFDPVLDSSNMNPKVWQTLAEMIATAYDHYDGFVILHGSDTMAFTASALSFMLQNLEKPVVLTGSQLPIGEIRTDAKENLITALEIAAAKSNGRSTVPEVCIYFDYQLFRGNRSIKYSAEKFEAFASPNYPVLAEAGIKLKFYPNYILPAGKGGLVCNTIFSDELLVLKLFPGITPSAVEAILGANVKAIILEAFGSGNTTTETWFIEALKRAVDEGKTIVDISQCKGGAVVLGLYQTSKALLDLGIISGSDMTFEATVTKLMYLMGQGYGNQEIRERFKQSLAGEIS